MIEGETGTGKDVVARSIHGGSRRKDGPFIVFDCGAVPENLIESELFGHEKGSFTGATDRQIGKFEQADKGTIFLDEVGDMSLKTQAKVLRVLQEQELERLGSNRVIKVDVRVIAATNKRLDEEIDKGTFASQMPGDPSQPRPDFALLGAIVEAPSGSYFFKFTGPRATVKAAHDAFYQFLDSVKPTS